MDRKQLEAFKSTILKMILREDDTKKENKPPQPSEAEENLDDAAADTAASGVRPGTPTKQPDDIESRKLGVKPATGNEPGLEQGLNPARRRGNVPGSMSETTPQSSGSSSGYGKLDGGNTQFAALGSDAYERARYATTNSSPSRVGNSETEVRARDRVVTDRNQRNATGGVGPGRGAPDRDPNPRVPTDNPAYADESPNATAASRSGGSPEPARTTGSSTSTSSTGTAPREPRRSGTSTSSRGTVKNADGTTRPATLADRTAGTFKPSPEATWTTDPSKVELDSRGRPLSINSDGSFNYTDPKTGEWVGGGPPKRSTGSSETNRSARDESRATRQGRVAQRIGDLAFRPARNADEDRRKREAEADVEAAYDEADAAGTRIGYEDAATLYRGFSRRGYGLSDEAKTRAAGQAAYDSTLKRELDAKAARDREIERGAIEDANKKDPMGAVSTKGIAATGSAIADYRRMQEIGRKKLGIPGTF